MTAMDRYQDRGDAVVDFVANWIRQSLPDHRPFIANAAALERLLAADAAAAGIDRAELDRVVGICRPCSRPNSTRGREDVPDFGLRLVHSQPIRE